MNVRICVYARVCVCVCVWCVCVCGVCVRVRVSACIQACLCCVYIFKCNYACVLTYITRVFLLSRRHLMII